MSGLFHRKSRSLSSQRQPGRPQTPINSNAHMAAAQAFLANKASQSNLSAAAAATAIRTMSPPPTQVDQIQTKRMQRRSSSASLSNAARGRGRTTLERQNSSGSMTERTFRRSPSPGRPPSRTGPEFAPPVPALPENIPPIPKNLKQSRRSASLDVAPARPFSPAMNKPGNRQSSVQPQGTQSASKTAALRSVGVAPPASTKPSVQKAAAAAATGTKPAKPAELHRTDSRNSINFSYPRPQSPSAASPSSIGAATSPSQTLQNGISPAEYERVQQGVIETSQQPVKKKKKKVAPMAAEGSHLQGGSMASRPITTPLAPGPEPAVEQVQPQPAKKKKKAAAVSGPSTHFPPSPASTQESDSDSTPEKQRRSQRASGVLLKQPSIVKEDWEGEQAQEMSGAYEYEEQSMSPVGSPPALQGKKGSASANTSRKIGDTASPPPQRTLQPSPIPIYHAVTNDVPTTQPSDTIQNRFLSVEQSQQDRGLSHSPSRATRFSDHLSSDLTTGPKHQPLPRSVSPVKSALKHNHEASPLEPGVARVRASSVSPSEASDSNLSADGSVQRKKSARVSFQPAPEIVGVAAEADELESPVITPPREQRRGFFGFGKVKSSAGTVSPDDTSEEHMRPRPQLPVFGSMRNRGRRTDSSEAVQTVTSQPAPRQQLVTTSSDSSFSTLQPTPTPEGISSDHAIGGILAREVVTKAPTSAPPARDPMLPLPPEVTTVEGSGSASDSESESSDIDDSTVNVPAVATAISQPSMAVQPQQPSAQVPIQTPTKAAEVPALAVHPPTPTPASAPEDAADKYQVEVPGGFPDASDESLVPKLAAPNKGLGIAESSAASTSVQAKRRGLVPGESDEEASDNDSIYSDAAEDPSELDGDGFGSINAIVESPIVPDSPATRLQTPPHSPLGKFNQTRPQEAVRTASWEAAQQRWSGIAQQTRQTSPQSQTLPVQPIVAQPSKPAKPKKKKKNYAAGAAVLAATGPPPAVRQPPPESPKARNQASSYPFIEGPPVDQNRESGAFRQSMRAQAAAPAPNASPNAPFRISMRNSGDAPRRPRSPPMSAPAPRPQSPQMKAPPPPQQRAALQKKHIPPAAGVQRATVAKPVAVPIANDSDSESSFKKSRRSKPSADGQYTMRRSMRASSVEPQQGTRQPKGRNAVRSLSPPQRRPFSPQPAEKQFRSTMRTSMETSTPTLRNPPEQKRSSSFFGRSRKAKSPTRTAPLPLTAPIRSRIADSDDEDEPRQQKYQSRYADSSDDEADQPDLRPVRGIPRKDGDADSTDLEDSSDEERQNAKKAQAPPPINTAVAQGTTVADAPVSPNTAKKRGLFSLFKSKKDKNENGKPNLTVPGETRREDEDDEDDGVVPSNLGFSSAVERDAMIAQTMAKLEAAKSNESASQPVANRTKPVRQTPQRIMSDSWPLPPKIPTEDEDRPSTADALPPQLNGSARPGPRERTFSADSNKDESGNVVIGRAAKKKRFNMLRKAFGLKD